MFENLIVAAEKIIEKKTNSPDSVKKAILEAKNGSEVLGYKISDLANLTIGELLTLAQLFEDKS